MTQMKKLFAGIIAVGISHSSYGVEIKENDNGLSEFVAIDENCKNIDNAKAAAENYCRNLGLNTCVVSSEIKDKYVHYSYQKDDIVISSDLKSPKRCLVYFNCGDDKNKILINGDFTIMGDWTY